MSGSAPHPPPHFLSAADLTSEQLVWLLDLAESMRLKRLERPSRWQWQFPHTLALVFEKPSLRTHVSFSVAATELGGSSVYLGPGDIGLNTREPASDVGAVLSRMAHMIVARVNRHQTLLDLVEPGGVPVVNALSELEHPCQALADLLTLKQRFGGLGNQLTLAWCGDGNNVLHSLLLACAAAGVNLKAACPAGLQPKPDVVQAARETASVTGAEIGITTSPMEAVSGANAVYTDVWTSMGDESQAAQRRAQFSGFQVDAGMMKAAGAGAVAMHCLPAHCGEEISAEVFNEHRALIMQQAENRLHAQKALVWWMLSGGAVDSTLARR
ncbi:MAG: ornithine carbamoyltransferase [Armatimonadetes bacterium]|nr:ornithine carbamoyltransferase [Armatimonadota bacterium]MDE2206960.1 ornithine carbamoyltransferase [Armatimonadota bacterium]